MKNNTLYNKARTLLVGGLMATMGVSLTGCSDFLEVDPQNVITQEQFWNEEGDVENIIAGCYSKMASYAVISRMMIWGEFRSENVINNGTIQKDVNLERVLRENLMANNAYTYYGDFYDIINRCNTVILYAPDVAAKDPSYTQSELKAHIAEVTALRSLCYFYLIRTFRDVPYSDEAFIDDNQEMALPAEKFDVVLGKLIESLEAVKSDAITYYGEASGLAGYYNTGRVTKKFIYALLCEMYLWQKNYDKCIEYADLIIAQMKKDAEDNRYTADDFKYVNGFPLIMSQYDGGIDQYGQAFNEIFIAGNSMESIFEINFDKESGDAQMSNGPASDFFGGQGRTPYVTYSTYIGQDQRDLVYKVFDTSNKGYDGRAYENMNLNGYYINKFSARGEVKLQSSSEAYETASYGGQWPTAGNNQDSRNKSNYIIYRLTDIMLLKAEALSQKIQTENGAVTEQEKVYLTQAFTLVNAINKRSLLQPVPKDTLYLSAYTTKEAITNLVYEERHRELMFEGKRYFDLVRRSQREGNTDYLRSKAANRDSDIRSVIDSKMKNMDAIYWPYNLDETKANPALKQNPAFGSGENSSYETNN